VLPPPYAAGANVPIGTAFPEESSLIENPVPFCYDYSHLVGSSVNQQSKRVDAARFEELLTDYDRILLGFGMRILIPSDDSPSQSME
jgi:hypothetical protein